MRTCSKTQKYSIAHNFFSFVRNIGMLHLVSIVLMRGIQLKKNFSNWSYPVLTTTQNDEKLHIFYFDSLVILSMWAHYAWRDMYRWGECIWTGVIQKLEWEHAVKLRNIQLLITSYLEYCSKNFSVHFMWIDSIIYLLHCFRSWRAWLRSTENTRITSMHVGDLSSNTLYH